jgi:hypothetical protein
MRFGLVGRLEKRVLLSSGLVEWTGLDWLGIVTVAMEGESQESSTPTSTCVTLFLVYWR